MAFKKFARKAVRKTTRFAKKRYTTRTGGARVQKLASDLYKVKRMLNVEHKHIDFKFGSGQTLATQYPTNTTPIIFALPMPVRGTSYNNRVGNQLRIVHITTKLKFLFKNNNDLTQRTNVRAQLIFAKNASDVPDITQLYELDANGHYTPMSMVNTQEYNKFMWLKHFDHKKGYTQPTNRFPLSGAGGATATPVGGATMDVFTPVSQSLNEAPFYSNKMGKTSIKVMFTNNSDDVAQMQPYVLLRSDVIDNGANPDYDPIGVSGIIRLTYVDN